MNNCEKKNKAILYIIRTVIAVTVILALLLPQYAFYYAFRMIDYLFIILIRVSLIIIDFCLYMKLCRGYHLHNMDLFVIIPLSLVCIEAMSHNRIVTRQNQFWLVYLSLSVDLMLMIERSLIHRNAENGY